MQLIKVTAECNMIQLSFQQLAGAVQLHSVDLLTFNISPSPSDQPNSETHSNIKFWNKSKFLMWLESYEAQLANRAVPSPSLPATIPSPAVPSLSLPATIPSPTVPSPSLPATIPSPTVPSPSLPATIPSPTVPSPSLPAAQQPINAPTPQIKVINTLTTLALAASQIILPPLPPVNPLLEYPPKSTINTLPLDNIAKKEKNTKNTKSGTKSKMRPSPTKNRQNLCALRRLKQTKSNDTTEEFNAYYSSLTSTQRTEYDNDVANLVATNT